LRRAGTTRKRKQKTTTLLFEGVGATVVAESFDQESENADEP
jgi:hypothetical protein